MNEPMTYALTCLLFFLTIASGAVFARMTGLTDKTAKALPFSVFALMALEYLFSAVGLMEAGVFFLLGLSAGLWIFSVIKGIRSGRRPLDGGFFVFAAVYAALCFGNYGRRVQFADEFNHWAALVKIMSEQGLLSSSAAANLSHASYPPAMAMLQYIPERIATLFDGSVRFSEQYLYLAYETAAATIPFFVTAALAKEKKPVSGLIPAVLFTAALFPFAPRLLRFITIDGYMGLVFGLGAILILTAGAGKRDVFAFSLLSFALTLQKNTGVIYAAVLCLTAAIALRGENRRLPLFGAGSAAAAYFSWQILLKAGGAVSKFDLSGGLFSADKAALLPGLLSRYFRTTLTTGLFEADTLLPALFFIAFALLAALAFYVIRRSGRDRRVTTVLTVMLLSALILYLALPFAYAFIFPEADAMRSWDRYLAMPLSAALLVALFALIRVDPFETKRGRVLSTAVFALILCFFPYKEPARFITRHEAKQSASFAKGIDPAAAIPGRIPDDAKLLILEEEGKNGNEKQALRYLLLPRTVEFVDAGGKGHYRARNGAATEAEALLAYMAENDFSYLYIHTAGERFPEEFAAAFDSAIENGALYALHDGILKAAE